MWCMVEMVTIFKAFGPRFARNPLQNSKKENALGKVCPETDSPVFEESVSKSKTLGHSGDL